MKLNQKIKKKLSAGVTNILWNFTQKFHLKNPEVCNWSSEYRELTYTSCNFYRVKLWNCTYQSFRWNSYQYFLYRFSGIQQNQIYPCFGNFVSNFDFIAETFEKKNSLVDCIACVCAIIQRKVRESLTEFIQDLTLRAQVNKVCLISIYSGNHI